jgi:hypothetical protein
MWNDWETDISEDSLLLQRRGRSGSLDLEVDTVLSIVKKEKGILSHVY